MAHGRAQKPARTSSRATTRPRRRSFRRSSERRTFSGPLRAAKRLADRDLEGASGDRCGEPRPVAAGLTEQVLHRGSGDDEDHLPEVLSGCGRAIRADRTSLACASTGNYCWIGRSRRRMRMSGASVPSVGDDLASRLRAELRRRFPGVIMTSEQGVRSRTFRAHRAPPAMSGSPTTARPTTIHCLLRGHDGELGFDSSVRGPAEPDSATPNDARRLRRLRR
jgi:hypothetical protein